MIEKLELLLALAKERHFGRAAESCGVTQPTMSTSLKQLEEILGVMLVQRGSRFQGFTPEGERVLDWARRIVGDARAMRQEIKGLKDQLSGEIHASAQSAYLDDTRIVRDAVTHRLGQADPDAGVAGTAGKCAMTAGDCCKRN